MTVKAPGRLVDLDEAPGGTEVIADQLASIADSVRRLLAGRLTEEAIVVLIHASLPRGMKMSHSQIINVLEAAARLDARFTKDK